MRDDQFTQNGKSTQVENVTQVESSAWLGLLDCYLTRTEKALIHVTLCFLSSCLCSKLT